MYPPRRSLDAFIRDVTIVTRQETTKFGRGTGREFPQGEAAAARHGTASSVQSGQSGLTTPLSIWTWGPFLGKKGKKERSNTE